MPKPRKVYYIVQSATGCFGAASACSRLPWKWPNKKDAVKYLAELRGGALKGTIYWIDYEWD
jgi:hypothetical protein